MKANLQQAVLRGLTKMKTIAIIPARGGSKRIPRKNIKDFLGKPMLAYAIEAAKNSEIFDEIMVSTDDNEIAQIAKKYSANVPFMRSGRTSSDFATTYDVIEEVIGEYKKNNKEFDILCCIYPCVPFLRAETLLDAFNTMSTNGNDAIMPVCKYPVPIEWAMRIENGILIPNDREAQNMRSQDIKPKYFDAGMFYFCKVEKIYEFKSLVPKNTAGYIINEQECQDIDTPQDWQAAEIKYRILNNV